MPEPVEDQTPPPPEAQKVKVSPMQEFLDSLAKEGVLSRLQEEVDHSTSLADLNQYQVEGEPFLDALSKVAPHWMARKLKTVETEETVGVLSAVLYRRFCGNLDFLSGKVGVFNMPEKQLLSDLRNPYGGLEEQLVDLNRTSQEVDDLAALGEVLPVLIIPPLEKEPFEDRKWKVLNWQGVVEFSGELEKIFKGREIKKIPLSQDLKRSVQGVKRSLSRWQRVAEISPPYPADLIKLDESTLETPLSALVSEKLGPPHLGTRLRDLLASGHWFEVISRAAQRGGLGEGQQIIARLSKERTFQTALEEIEAIESLLAKEGVEIQVKDVLGIFFEECTNQGSAIFQGLETLETFKYVLSESEGEKKEKFLARQDRLTEELSKNLDDLRRLVDLAKEFPFLASYPKEVEPDGVREMFYKIRVWAEGGQRRLSGPGLAEEFKDQADALLEIGYLRRLE